MPRFERRSKRVGALPPGAGHLIRAAAMLLVLAGLSGIIGTMVGFAWALPGAVNDGLVAILLLVLFAAFSLIFSLGMLVAGRRQIRRGVDARVQESVWRRRSHDRGPDK